MSNAIQDSKEICVESAFVKSFKGDIHMSCHVMSCHVMSCHVMLCRVVSFHAMPCHVMSWQILSLLSQWSPTE